MELPVSLQLRELGLALALGAALATLCELLRPIRRRPVLTALLDAFYCLFVLAALLLFALYAGRGRLRLFALGAACLSGGLTLLVWETLRKFLKKAAKKAKKMLHLPKNLLQ